MKKKIIAAGAASAVLAAMPVIATFAIVNPDGTPKTDTLSMELGDLCTLYRGSTHASDVSDFHTAPTVGGVTGSWSQSAGATGSGATSSADTFSAVVVPGNEYSGIATSTFNVTCNDAAGYHVSVDTEAFTSTDATGTPDTWAYSDTGAYATGTNTAGATLSSWYLTSSAKTTTSGADTVPAAIADGGDVWTLASDGTKIGTSSFTITYNVKVGTDQTKGTYTADAEYTLAAIPVNPEP